jgi:hypothetical protein
VRKKETLVQRLLLAASLLVLVFVGSISCGSFGTTPINKILENPRDYAGKTVTISGEVKEVFSLLVIRYFTVRDKSDEMIVVTQKPLPTVGKKIKVKGKVEEAFSLGDKRLIVIVEENP